MKTQKDIISDIDLIVGRNNEITDETHMDLVDEIVDYIQDFASQPAVSEDEIACPFCDDEGFDKPGLKYHLRHYCVEYSIAIDIDMIDH